jgi:hypothetical protein
VIPTLYAGTTLDCALMETVFYDVPYAAGPKMHSKAKHVASHSSLRFRLDLTLVDLSTISLRRLGISRPELIDTDSSHYDESREWALALHEQYPVAQGLKWISRRMIPRRHWYYSVTASMAPLSRCWMDRFLCCNRMAALATRCSTWRLDSECVWSSGLLIMRSVPVILADQYVALKPSTVLPPLVKILPTIRRWSLIPFGLVPLVPFGSSNL